MKKSKKVRYPFPIVLASTSPRRVDLMGQVGLPFRAVSPSADETPRRGEKPRALVARLAREKAVSVAEPVLAGDARALIVSADTIVVAPGGKQILGKPVDRADAERMLGLLLGRTHEVLTGYCLLWLERGARPRAIVRVVRSRVKMRKLGRAEIRRYVETGEPMDKAGAYAAQGIGMGLIESLQGSYSNVVGLPMAQLLKDMEDEFAVPFLAVHAGSAREPATSSPISGAV